MARLFLLLLVAVVAVHVVSAGRNILSETKPVELSQNTVHRAKTDVVVVTGAGVKDKKNFISYGGVGGWAGVGFAAGVLPVGGLGGASGIGGLGSLGGLGGAGGGGAGGLGGVGGVGGAGGGAGGVGGGIVGGKVLP